MVFEMHARAVPRSPTLKSLAVVALVAICSQVLHAEELSADESHAAAQREADLGLNIFGLSFHTNRSAGYNEVNPGLGLRYVFARPSPNWALFGDASFYYDSNREWAKYVALGAYYSLSPSWKIGGALAYGQSRSYNEGQPFFAPIPGVAFLYRRIAFNMVVLPSDEAAAKIAGFAFFLTVPLERGD